MQAPPPAPDAPPPNGGYPDYGDYGDYGPYDTPGGFGIAHWIYYVYIAFWIWMLVDSIKRYGLSYWIWLILVFQGFGPVIYFILHAKVLFRGGLFGPSVGSRIKKAEAALRIAPTEAARADLAELYFEAKRFDDAEALFQKVVADDPESVEARYYIGVCRLLRDDPAGALEPLRFVYEKDKKLRFGKAWLAYADCLGRLGRRDEAIEEHRKLARHYPRPLTEYAYAKILADNGEKAKARETLEEMLATSDQAPREDRQWLGKGRSLLREVS